MTGTCFLMLSVVAALSSEPQQKDPGSWWQRRLAEKGKQIAAGGSRVVFLGDSTVHYFENGGSGMGKTVWDKFWAGEPYKAINLGFGGDKTENILWRITEGRELDGYSAKVIILLAGANNIGQRNDPAADIISGIWQILKTIRTKQPTAKTVLCALLPCGEKPDDPRRIRAAVVNRELQKFANGRDVIWCDCTDRFLLSDGTLLRDIMPNFQHPREEGYYLWTAALLPLVNSVLRDDGLLIGSSYPSRLGERAYATNALPESLRPVTRFCQPSGRGENWWGDRLVRNRNFIRDHRGGIDLVMVGDSITHFWEDYGGKAYQSLTNRLTVLNCGYGGDQTQNLLWRLRNGELDGYKAKTVMLMIGTNNNGIGGYDPANTAAGTKACLALIREKQPQAKVILCGCLPRAVGTKDGDPAYDSADARNRKTNDLIRPLADGKKVIWLDFTDKFRVNGKVPKELMDDYIHPTEKGYLIWLKALEDLHV